MAFAKYMIIAIGCKKPYKGIFRYDTRWQAMLYVKQLTYDGFVCLIYTWHEIVRRYVLYADDNIIVDADTDNGEKNISRWLDVRRKTL